MGKWGYSDDEEEEEEEEVEEQQPVAEEVQAREEEYEQEQERVEVEQIRSAPASPNRKAVGYARGIKYTMSEKDFGKLLNEEQVEFEKIEYEFDDSNKFTGKAKVFLANSVSVDNFLKLNEVEINGVLLRTKLWEPNVGKKRPERGAGGRGGEFGGRGDRFDRPGRGGRDERDNTMDRRGPRRGPGSGDARNMPDNDYKQRPRDHRDSRPAPLTKSRDENDTTAPIAFSATRPKLNLQPRTLPVEIIGKLPQPSPSSSQTNIFGSGKPQDLTGVAQKPAESAAETVAPPVPPSEEMEKLTVSVTSSEDLPNAPNTTSSTNTNNSNNTNNKVTRNNHNNNNSREKKEKKDRPSSTPSPAPESQNKEQKEAKESKKKHKEYNKDNKKGSKGPKEPVVTVVAPVVDEVPSDFTVIGSSKKSTSAATTPTNTSSNKVSTVATNTAVVKPVASKSSITAKTKFSVLLSDSDEDSD